MPLIDLRSDTVTKPTPEMRRAMAEAEVGDDVFGDDPTVNALEARAAELLGQELIAGEQSHIVLDEAAGHAVVVGASVRVIREAPDGTMDPEAVRGAFRNPMDLHQPLSVEYIREIGKVAHEGGVPLHIDGARFWNAVVALDADARELAAPADSVTFCLSKGLACPIGSILVGS